MPVESPAHLFKPYLASSVSSVIRPTDRIPDQMDAYV